MKSVRSYLKLMRPTQWIKNGFVLMPLIFSSHLTHIEDLVKTLGLLVSFCLASSITYIFNDYMDMDQDKVHPLKKHRPLASGAVSPSGAFLLEGVLTAGLVVLLGASMAPVSAYLLIIAYLILHLVYSYKLKDLVIFDVLAIAAGFLIRVIAGAVVIGVVVSSWLIMCTFSLAIFLALGKRRHEVVILCDEAGCHRPVLDNYNIPLLDQLVQVATTSTFIFYCLYCVQGTGFMSEKMMLTIPFVTYGLFRYLYLIYMKEDGGSPTALLLTDPPLLVCGIIWLTACVAIIYS